MGHQPMIRPLSALAVAVALASCVEEPEYEGAFVEPIAAAVLHPDEGGPFREPVGFVANAHGGLIWPLALKQGRFLTDDRTASFLRTNALPTGGGRVLSSVEVWVDADDAIRVFAGDRAYGHLVELPYPDSSGARFVRVNGPFPGDGNTGDATLSRVEVKQGYTSTERWTVEYDDAVEGWWVTGSRSGRQEHIARQGEAFIALKRAVGFTIEGRGDDGDTFAFDTDNGLVEHDVGGAPLVLSLAPDGTTLAIIVQDAALDRPVLRWFDLPTRAVTGEVALPPDAAPHRLAWSEAGTLYAADAGRLAVWSIELDGTATEHLMPWPTLDVDILDRTLFVAPRDGREVWRYDLDAGVLLDANPHLPGLQGMAFPAPVLGLTSVPLPHLRPGSDDRGTRLSGRSVAIALHDGRVVFMEEESGCLVQDALGPRTALSSSFGSSLDYDSNFDTTPNAPFLQINRHNNRHVLVSQCGGLAQPELWSMRFDRTQAAWNVFGNLSGVQQGRAFEEERYLSDDGSISFTVRSGSAPTQDGWQINFRVDAGILEAEGIDDTDTEARLLSVPGDPVYFHYTAGQHRVVPVLTAPGTWGVEVYETPTDRPYVLVLGQGSDSVHRIDPQDGASESVWD